MTWFVIGSARRTERSDRVSVVSSSRCGFSDIVGCLIVIGG